MTTTFTAIPVKITTSAMRFLGCDMGRLYPRSTTGIIDRDQTNA
jgi:hypothetical protein